ncbi:hypothetical protein [Streptomyces sp. NPDC096152]
MYVRAAPSLGLPPSGHSLMLVTAAAVMLTLKGAAVVPWNVRTAPP